MTTYTDRQRACIDRVREALPEFARQEDYLLAHGASLMSESSHEIIHIDTLRKIVEAVLETTSPITAFSEPAGAGDVRGEPIMWFISNDPDDDGFVVHKEREAKDYERDGADVTPLYAAPLPRASDAQAPCPHEWKRMTEPVALGLDGLIESAIECSDGRWCEDEFRINGKDLMNLCRSVALLALPRASDSPSTAAQGATLTDEQWHNAVNAALAEDPDNGLLQSAVDWVQKTCDERDVYGVAYRALQHYFAMHKKLPPSDNYAAPTPVADSDAQATAAQGATLTDGTPLAIVREVYEKFAADDPKRPPSYTEGALDALDIVEQRIVDVSPTPVADSGMWRERALKAEATIASLFATAAAAKPVSVDAAFQQRVQPWMLECFGPEISADVTERCHRLFEEAGETCQSKGMTRSEAHQLVDYTWDRPIGDPYQEVGGVMVTLAAFCLAAGIDMHAAGETELARIWTKVETIRAKQAAKPKHSPLPEHVMPSGDDESFTGRIRRTRLTPPAESTGEPQL